MKNKNFLDYPKNKRGKKSLDKSALVDGTAKSSDSTDADSKEQTLAEACKNESVSDIDRIWH